MKLLIIKTGTTFNSVKKEFGDFEDFIIRQMDIPYKCVLTVPVYQGKVLPDITDFSAVIIKGSHSMVSNCEKWSMYTAQWLRESLNKHIPILGICYGHQLLAFACGGNVDYHPKGREVGTTMIHLTSEGKVDSLFKVLPEIFLGHVTHAQTVITAPIGATRLARNLFEAHQAFTINNCVWGVQFHPEFNADIIKLYIREQEAVLIKEGYDIDMIYESVSDNNYGKLLLKRFIELSR